MILYTCITGDYDQLIEHTVQSGWRQICFTDKNIISDTWEIIKLNNANNKTCREVKINPHKFLPKHEISVWVDGNITPEIDLNELIKDKDYCLMRHPLRSNIYQEAFECIILKKAKLEIVLEQIKKYGTGVNGLVATGVIIRKNNAKNNYVNELWWEEVKKHSRRDQLSFNYVAQKCDLDYQTIGFLEGFKYNTHKNRFKI